MTNTTPNRFKVALHIPPHQFTTICRAAKLAHTSPTNFILDSACRIAEQTLMGPTHLFDHVPQDNPGLNDLLSRPAPWDS